MPSKKKSRGLLGKEKSQNESLVFRGIRIQALSKAIQKD